MSQKLPVVSKANIVDVLATLSGNMFIGIDTVTAVKLPGGQKNTLQNRVFKVTTGMRARIFQNKFVNGYEAAVKKQMLEEGKDPDTFTVGPRPWGTRIPETPLIEHKGSYYLETLMIEGSKPETYYLVDNKPVKVVRVNDNQQALVNDQGEELTLLPKEVVVGEEQQGGVDKPVVIRTFKLDSILNLRCNHTEYQNLYYQE